MKTVTVYNLKGGEDNVAGTITWDGSQLTAKGMPFVERMPASPVFDAFSGQQVTSDEQPERWLGLLHTQYNSAYLRASKPVEQKE